MFMRIVVAAVIGVSPAGAVSFFSIGGAPDPGLAAL